MLHPNNQELMVTIGLGMNFLDSGEVSLFNAIFHTFRPETGTNIVVVVLEEVTRLEIFTLRLHTAVVVDEILPAHLRVSLSDRK